MAGFSVSIGAPVVIKQFLKIRGFIFATPPENIFNGSRQATVEFVTVAVPYFLGR
jgi:hypothetical protein